MNTITEGSKLIAEYIGCWYISQNDLKGFPFSGWWGKTNDFENAHYVKKEEGFKCLCREHEQLPFSNDFNTLIPVIEKLESEDLSEFHYEWEDKRGKHNNFMSVEFIRWYNESSININLQLDPSNDIGRHEGEGIIKDTFYAVVDAIKHINKLRDE